MALHKIDRLYVSEDARVNKESIRAKGERVRNVAFDAPFEIYYKRVEEGGSSTNASAFSFPSCHRKRRLLFAWLVGPSFRVSLKRIRSRGAKLTCAKRKLMEKTSLNIMSPFHLASAISLKRRRDSIPNDELSISNK